VVEGSSVLHFLAKDLSTAISLKSPASWSKDPTRIRMVDDAESLSALQR